MQPTKVLTLDGIFQIAFKTYLHNVEKNSTQTCFRYPQV